MVESATPSPNSRLPPVTLKPGKKDANQKGKGVRFIGETPPAASAAHAQLDKRRLTQLEYDLHQLEQKVLHQRWLNSATLPTLIPDMMIIFISGLRKRLPIGQTIKGLLHLVRHRGDVTSLCWRVHLRRVKN